MDDNLIDLQEKLRERLAEANRVMDYSFHQDMQTMFTIIRKYARLGFPAPLILGALEAEYLMTQVSVSRGRPDRDSP